ncbi:MAG: type II secretion system GspH family protein [Gemmatimonadota bacterium]|nr:type II secretion system GspH family protein [Gemmatimonadota bacterium]
MRRGERGIALLEAIVALALLAGAGTTLVAALSAALRSENELRRREATLLAADRVLTAMTLLTRTDLDRRLGVHPVREFEVAVQRPEPTLYRISIAEARAPEIETLVTVVYRPEADPR